MKQHLTVQDIMDAPNKVIAKIFEMDEDKVQFLKMNHDGFVQNMAQVMTIGKMIWILEGYYSNLILNSDTQLDKRKYYIYRDYRAFEDGVSISEADDLCDCLWMAVKSIL